MPSSTWADRFARAFAILRGAMVIAFSVMFIVAPEKMIPGSATEPARTLVLMLASRTILLGIALLALAIGRKREALAWVLLADAALQLFDTGMAVVTDKGALAVFPAALGALDVWAALVLRRGRTGVTGVAGPLMSRQRRSVPQPGDGRSRVSSQCWFCGTPSAIS